MCYEQKDITSTMTIDRLYGYDDSYVTNCFTPRQECNITQYALTNLISRILARLLLRLAEGEYVPGVN